MESNKILKADVLDIIFEHQNKQYGAYELRKNYHKRARIALMAAATFAIVISGIPLIAGLLISDHNYLNRTVTLTTIRTDLPKPPKPKHVDPPAANPTDAAPTPKVSIPIITTADSVYNDVKPVASNEMSKPGPVDPTSTETGPVGPATGEGKPTTEQQIVETVVVKETTHESGELHQLPEFPGGEDAMIAFLKSHLIYPKRAQDADKDGRVVLEFIVDKEGRISDIDLLKKAGFGFDEEAVRVMGLMPEWKPGKINGAPVKARYQIPITFELED